MSLKSQLIGLWELVSYNTHKEDGSRGVVHCSTEGCRGVIAYSLEGFMSAQLQIPRQGPSVTNVVPWSTSRNRWQGWEGDEFMYSGRYCIEQDCDKAILVHYIQICSYRSWLGVIQRRAMEFVEEEGEEFLFLGEAGTASSREDPIVASMKWKKLRVHDMMPA